MARKKKWIGLHHVIRDRIESCINELPNELDPERIEFYMSICEMRMAIVFADLHIKKAPSLRTLEIDIYPAEELISRIEQIVGLLKKLEPVSSYLQMSIICMNKAKYLIHDGKSNNDKKGA